MKWYKKLYLGDNAKKAKYKVFGKICRNRFSYNTFLITLSDTPGNLLEIYSVNLLKQPYYREKEVKKNIYVVGLAAGYNEAVNVMQQIIEEVYAATGAFDIRSYLKFGLKK